MRKRYEYCWTDARITPERDFSGGRKSWTITSALMRASEKGRGVYLWRRDISASRVIWWLWKTAWPGRKLLGPTFCPDRIAVLRCINMRCDFSVKVETIARMREHVEKPCPKCGDLYLTEEALDGGWAIVNVVRLIKNMAGEEGPRIEVTS